MQSCLGYDFPGGIGNVDQDVFFAKNFSDLVTESFRNVWDLKV